MVFASMGRPPATLADLDVLPEVLREVVADCLSGDPGFRPDARAVVLTLLGDGPAEAGTLAEGARRAAQVADAARRAAAEREAQLQARAAGRAGRPGGPAADPRAREGRPRDGRAHDGRELESRGHGGRPDGEHAGAGRPAPGGTHGRRVPVLPVAIALVLTAAIVFVLVHLAGGAEPARAPGAGAGTPPTSSTSPVSSTDSAAPSPPATIPAGFAGTWAGQVKEPGPAGITLSVNIGLARGSAPGTIAYAGAGGFACSGELSPQSSRGGSLTLSQGIINGQSKCGNGTVVLSSTAAGLTFSFRGAGAGATTGILART
jgi:hypothetical protein